MPKKTSTDNLTDTALNWARAHIMKQGESDLFPTAFEYEAYENQWSTLLQYLSGINLEDHEVSPAIRMMVPKSRTGYRAAAQLDPFDCLLYTAAAYEVADAVERFRADPARKIACAYRVEIKPDGQFFQKTSGWPDFHARSVELAKKKDCSYVVCADVSDFYNQISHHRVQNALSTAGVPDPRSRNIEAFLSNLTAHHHSRGLPVGPSASILISEACLADVDNCLLRKGYKHTRYVDDFRIFCPSRTAAIQALHDLSEYLYTAHRLSLQGGKTHTYKKSVFQRKELTNPEDLEVKTKAERLKHLLDELDFSPYGDVDLDDIQEKQKEAVLETIQDLFEQLIANPPIHYGLARQYISPGHSLADSGYFQTSN